VPCRLSTLLHVTIVTVFIAQFLKHVICVYFLEFCDLQLSAVTVHCLFVDYIFLLGQQPAVKHVFTSLLHACFISVT
jgi:uncharacterized protein YqhQ